ncbi:MAG: glycosyltransferase [Candidatus Eisenbacteria bacterium]|uniref:Glycosyltransferase n=1 Tax=Eiseniibacteriota bacterium TaxID=2212470 RepID=A0A538SCT0_UNCEI|nr:MAG: glycosyltransferase [Candidatus Eisenbacteria bacterium]
MPLSLVVVHYHTRPALERLIRSLRESRPSPLRELLVVNNSAEPIEDLVRDLPWPARVIAPGRNLGYARGVNEGIRAAKEDRVLILNPDLLVRPGSIEALERCADEHPRAGILAPKLLNPDGTLQLSARRFYNWKTLLLRRAPLGPYANLSRTLRNHLMTDWDHADTRTVDWVLGAAMLARKRAVRDVGLMDERYFLYFEDVDWCQRMWRHGYEVLYCAEATMVHEYARGSAQLRARSIRAHAAGLLRFAEKWSAVVYAVSRFRGRILSLAALVTDVLAAVLAFLAAYGIRTALNGLFEKPVFPLPSYGGLLFFTIAVTVAAMAANGLYRRTTFADSIERAFSTGFRVPPRPGGRLGCGIGARTGIVRARARGRVRAAGDARPGRSPGIPGIGGGAPPRARRGRADPDRVRRARALRGAVPPRRGRLPPRFGRRDLLGRLRRAAGGRGAAGQPGQRARGPAPRPEPRALGARAEARERSLALDLRGALPLGRPARLPHEPRSAVRTG